MSLSKKVSVLRFEEGEACFYSLSYQSLVNDSHFLLNVAFYCAVVILDVLPHIFFFQWKIHESFNARAPPNGFFARLLPLALSHETIYCDVSLLNIFGEHEPALHNAFSSTSIPALHPGDGLKIHNFHLSSSFVWAFCCRLGSCNEHSRRRE